jgi:hypothetical protein
MIDYAHSDPFWLAVWMWMQWATLPVSVLGLALAAWGIVHDKPAARARIVPALVLAVLLAAATATVMADDIPVTDKPLKEYCATLSAWDWEYWLAGCYGL